MIIPSIIRKEHIKMAQLFLKFIQLVILESSDVVQILIPMVCRVAMGENLFKISAAEIIPQLNERIIRCVENANVSMTIAGIKDNQLFCIFIPL
jgi:hypothetical protein